MLVLVPLLLLLSRTPSVEYAARAGADLLSARNSPAEYATRFTCELRLIRAMVISLFVTPCVWCCCWWVDLLFPSVCCLVPLGGSLLSPLAVVCGTTSHFALRYFSCCNDSCRNYRHIYGSLYPEQNLGSGEDWHKPVYRGRKNGISLFGWALS